MAAEKKLLVLIDDRNQADRHLQQISCKLKNAAEMRVICAIIEPITLKLTQAM